MEKIKFTLIVFISLFANYCFSQLENNSTFNASYWNAYADKIHLSGKEREEFISSHQRLNSPAPLSVFEGTQTSPFAQRTFTQSNNTFAGPCVNADFELGNLTGWNPTCGFNPGFNAMGCCPNAGGQQSITSGPSLDPYGGFPIVLPGGNYSLRLGNNINGGEADRIEQTFLVSPANANFSYKYAVVLEDPGHPQIQQPFFEIQMIDTNSVQIPCTHFYVAAGQNIPGFFNSASPGVIYKPWTTVLIDLSPYIGQNVTIQFSAYDCSLGGHFGYAYIDGVCQSFVGGGSANICAADTFTFCAPTGLASYTWNGPSVSNVVNQCVNASAPGVYTVQTTLFSNCNGPSFTYTLTNQPAPLANAGPNATVCANNNVVSLSGSITGFSSTPQWSSSGSGVFNSSTSLATTYTPSAAEISAGSVTLTLATVNNGICAPSISTVEVVIIPSPTANAGSDQTICTNTTAALSGTITGSTNTGSWTSSGSGTFSPSANILNPTYLPSATDLSSGSVTITLTSTGNQGCFAANDNMVLFFQTPPLANAGLNPTVCINNSTVNLSGAIIGFSATPQWSSSGTGVFTSTANLNTNYIPSAADILGGSFTLSLTTQNNGVCPPSTSTIQVQITPAPVVSAGINQTVCSTSTISLNGNVSGPTNTGSWSGNGDGSFSPTSNSVVTNYIPGPNDINNGNVTLILTSTGNGNCFAVTSSVTINISKIAVVNAGLNHSICSTTSTINLNGNISGVTSTGFWTTNGSGSYNPGAGFLNTNYFVSLADLTNGSVAFTLTSTNNGPCPAVTNTMQVNIIPLAQLNAGLNQLICESQGIIALAGISTSNGIWTSSGTGSFAPNNSNLAPTYSITPTDVSAGFVTFTLSSANNAPCPVVHDSVRINIRRIAVVNAGSDVQVCSTNSSVSLSGSVSIGSTAGVWSTLGNGSFIPSATTLSTSYLYSANDLSAGSVYLILTSLNNGICPAVTDTLKVKLFKDPIINLLSDTTICSYQNPLFISAGLTGDYGSLQWTSNGTGTFTPNNVVNPNKYKFSPKDISLGRVTLSLALSNNGPCSNKTSSIVITINPSPIADFIASKYVANIPNDPITFTNKSTHADSYIWDFGDGNSTTLINPIHNYVSANFYDVTLIAVNQFGCKDTAVEKITVKSDVQFPNVFTPNLNGPNGGSYNINDYSNDVFFPYTSGVTEYDLKIFNRYGELIFQSSELKVGWDGYFNGKLCQQDAYVWKANMTFFDGRAFQKVGSVTLLR
jgi:gliding motility-associated-like protein